MFCPLVRCVRPNPLTYSKHDRPCRFEMLVQILPPWTAAALRQWQRISFSGPLEPGNPQSRHVTLSGERLLWKQETSCSKFDKRSETLHLPHGLVATVLHRGRVAISGSWVVLHKVTQLSVGENKAILVIVWLKAQISQHFTLEGHAPWRQAVI